MSLSPTHPSNLSRKRDSPLETPICTNIASPDDKMERIDKSIFFFLLIQMRDEKGLSLKQKGEQTQEVFRR